MRTAALIPLVLLCLAPPAAASEQMPDQLSYKGKQHALLSTPLEVYLAKHPRRRPKTRIASSDCERGYVARWEIRGARLRLVAILDCDEKPMALGAIPKRARQASWYTGVLRVPIGKRIQLVHHGFHSLYEKDLVLWIRRGKVVRSRVFDNRPGKRARISRPRRRPVIDRALRRAREMIARACFPKGRGPKRVGLELRVTAAGVLLDLELHSGLSIEDAACVRTAVRIKAAFSPADGMELIRHDLELR